MPAYNQAISRIEAIGNDQEYVQAIVPAVEVKPSTPFQAILDSAVNALQGVSDVEHKTNTLIEKFVKDEVSAEEVTIATAELNLKISMVTTVVNSVATTLKEVMNMQV